MRTKFHSALVTLGLAVTALSKAGYAEVSAPVTPRMELVVDTTLHPAELHLTLPKQTISRWDSADVTAFGSNDFTGLDLALARPGVLFGVPHNFLSLSLRISSGATTGVAFPNLSK